METLFSQTDFLLFIKNIGDLRSLYKANTFCNEVNELKVTKIIIFECKKIVLLDKWYIKV